MSNFLGRIIKHWTLVILFIGMSLMQLAIMKWSYDASQEVKGNAELIAENARETCENRAAGRKVVRYVMHGFLDELPPSPEVTELKGYIEDNYPEINCDLVLKD